MHIFLISVGVAGFFLCRVYRASIDASALRTWGRLRTWARRRFGQRPNDPSDLILLQQVQAKLRSGQSLDGALESLLGSSYLPLAQKKRISALLQAKPERDFLSQFLASALETGMPLLTALTALQRSLLSEKRLRLKAQAVTSQARAQGTVLSWLPWCLAAGILALDPAWFFVAARSSFAWVLWAFACLLVGAGRLWMGHLLRRALSPHSTEEWLEEETLPKLVLRLVAELSLGRDPETALDRSWEGMEDARLRPAFQSIASRENSLGHFQFLFTSAAATGAPLRDDLLRFLEELHIQGESRWEERVQKLPVVMMAPLFTCFLPSALLVMGGLVLPLVKDF